MPVIQEINHGATTVAICSDCEREGYPPIIGQVSSDNLMVIRAHYSIWHDHAEQLGHPITVVDAKSKTSQDILPGRLRETELAVVSQIVFSL
jgi:hypothetical protein